MHRANIFVVGRDGCGKTSTWCSILSKEMGYKPESSIKIDDNLCLGIGTSDFRNGNINGISAIDGKGIGCFDIDKQCNNVSLVEAIRKAIPNEGITAFVIVMKYGSRYTKLEKDTVERIQHVFGEEVFRKWGVLVFTHGDDFERDCQDKRWSFDDWYALQIGDIASLFDDFGHRYVLFNNKAQDKQSMVKQLMDKVDELRVGPYKVDMLQDGPYTRGILGVDQCKLNLPQRWRFKVTCRYVCLGAVMILVLVCFCIKKNNPPRKWYHYLKFW
ncbi:uncharacterized protein LOC131938116 [Physella acuta]|uniref:uncharacterized protein LOC131938116 n=1 Tax=Physella acuta TaxID=109671 RepID=UPI0027DBB81B|nr:uncharacterized protein LOC131938116 [Physella acuta]